MACAKIPVKAMMTESELIGKNLDELIYISASLNHFHWHLVKDLTGNDLTSKIIDKLYDGGFGIQSNIFDVPFFKEQLKQMNMIPCFYHCYYYRYDEMLENLLEEYNDSNVGTRAQQVQKTESELFELYKDPNLNYKTEQLEKRGGAH